MRACVQRVSRAGVEVDGRIVGEIGQGLLVLLGVAADDDETDAVFMANKIARLRLFEDDEGKMNRSVEEAGGSVLAVSQFTLLGDCRKGRRPSFVKAAEPAAAAELYEQFVELLRDRGLVVATGQFRAQMDVSLVNDGPVTLLVDSRKQF
ncbi:MAG: D-aminoacyl-tRNA deacylase [Pirellulaceae bacterium]|jgi:D-tyrosyl-tRNA(Tyr) deacylase|nr:D-aminoacyl-tRNA deacylase [Pirellulaceae bacterium]MDP7020371.1 D-aminoacyl-tRNA deacylase [Pirellulaceae bacterium]